jgi:hypothetical protein
MMESNLFQRSPSKIQSHESNSLAVITTGWVIFYTTPNLKRVRRSFQWRPAYRAGHQLSTCLTINTA